MAKPRRTHQAFLALLQGKEAKGLAVTTAEILAATEWKAVSLETYVNKGQLSEYLSQIDEGKFAVANTLAVDPLTFSRKLSQSKHRRELGFNCKSGLAKALLKKSRDNMILALELYNRPSLENRLDSFVLCFCVAWEQLLKAIIIERDGEGSIFKTSTRSGAIRETISLRECLNRQYKENSPIRKNVARITYYRDQAVHLLMPEVQGIMSRIFQSGIMNYSTAFQKFSEQQFLPTSQAGMLSIVGDLGSSSNAAIIAKYGQAVGKELISISEALESEAKNVDDIQFAIPLNVKLVFATDDDQGNMVTLSKAEAGMEGLANAIVVEKPVDRSKTHPFRATDAVKEINRRLKERYSEDVLREYLKAGKAKPDRTSINEFDFRALAYKLKWRNSNNSEHYLHKNPETRYYSDSAVEKCIEKIMNTKGFLGSARASASAKK
ncbi:MAG: DUF3644 domain-containing protein [Gammaproteobacteria bacterium]|nr:DUF3644 domain-containing protein [Gammaproteobacteria bacterium]